jgi:hypothetical protein
MEMARRLRASDEPALRTIGRDSSRRQPRRTYDEAIEPLRAKLEALLRAGSELRLDADHTLAAESPAKRMWGGKRLPLRRGVRCGYVGGSSRERSAV